MPRTRVYRTPLPDAVGFSLFRGEPLHHPRSRREEEYLASEELMDCDGRPISLTRYAEDGSVLYRRELRHEGGRLAEEREEFLDVGTTITRTHRFEGDRETIRVFFGDGLDEVIVRTLGADGALLREESTDAAGEPRSMTEWDSAGRVTHSEGLGTAQELSYDEHGNLLELVVQREDGSETIERAHVVDGKVVEVEIVENGEPVGSRAHSYEPGRIRTTESRRGAVTSSREETYGGDGRLVRVEESAGAGPGWPLRTVSTYAWESDGKRRSVEFSREGMTPMGASVVSGFRQFTYDERGRVAEILVCGPSEEEQLEADSYYRFDYVD